MIQSGQRLQQINRQQADDYWVLVRHVVCATYLGVHVVPVPYLEDAEHYNLMNVLLEKSEQAGSHLFQRKSFFPLGPLQRILVNIDSRTFEKMEIRVKRQTEYTKDFDYEELVIDEGSLKSVKLIAKDIIKEVSLFFLKPRLLKVSDTMPWICSVRSIYIICEVYTTNIQLLVTDSKLIQRYEPESRIPIAFLCRKFRLESTGLIGAELAMRRSPKSAKFVNSSSRVYRQVVVQDQSQTAGTPARCKGARRFFRSILPECCLSRSHRDMKSPDSAQGGSTTTVLGSIQANPSASTEQGSDGGYSRKTGSSRSSSNTPTPKSDRTPAMPPSSPLPINSRSLITLKSEPHNAEWTVGETRAHGSFSHSPLRETGTQPTSQTLKAAETSAASPYTMDSLAVPRKAVRSSALSQSGSQSPHSLQEIPGTSTFPQSIGEPFVQQTFAETAPLSNPFAKYPFVLHSTEDFINLTNLPQAIAETASSSDLIAENLPTPQPPAGLVVPERPVAAPRCFANTGAGGLPLHPARLSSSSSSSSSSGSRLCTTCPHDPRYRESEQQHTDSSALILTIKDLINILQAIVLSGISPPAARHLGLDQTCGALRTQEKREPSPPPAPGTHPPRLVRRRRPLWTSTSSSSTELSPRQPLKVTARPDSRLPSPPPSAPLREAVACPPSTFRETARPDSRLPSPPLSAPLREAVACPPSTFRETARPTSSLSVPSSNPHNESDQLPSHSPASLYDPPEEAAQPRNSPPLTLREATRPPAYQLTPLKEAVRGRIPVTNSNSEGEAIPPLAQSPPRRPPGPLPSDLTRCPCCGSLRTAVCSYELEWERHWAAAATPEPGADSISRCLGHMVPNSSDSEAEERADKSGR